MKTIGADFRGFRAEVDGDLLQLLIYGVIAEEGDEGEVLVRASEIARQLSEFPGQRINLYINSPGGIVHDAVAIHTALRRHPARKSVQIDGLCASAATIIALAGDTISAAPSAMLMVHAAHNVVRGNAEEMRQEAAVLDTLTQQIARLYMARTHRSLEEVLGWLRSETWLTAAEAKALGLIDAVNADSRAVARWDPRQFGLKALPTDRAIGANSEFRYVGLASLSCDALDMLGLSIARHINSSAASASSASSAVEASVEASLGAVRKYIEGFMEGFRQEMYDLQEGLMLANPGAAYRADMEACAEHAAESEAADREPAALDEDPDSAQAGASGATAEMDLTPLIARVRGGK